MAVKITVVFLQEFYRYTGRSRLEVVLEEPATVEKLIDYIDRRVKPGFKDMVVENGRVKYPVEIAVNGRRIEYLDGLSTSLRSGDRVVFSPRAFFVL